MNIPALTCQLRQAIGSLVAGHIAPGNLEDLRALAAEAELFTKVIYGQILPLVEAEQKANPSPSPAQPVGGLLDFVGKGGAA